MLPPLRKVLLQKSYSGRQPAASTSPPIVAASGTSRAALCSNAGAKTPSSTKCGAMPPRLAPYTCALADGINLAWNVKLDSTQALSCQAEPINSACKSRLEHKNFPSVSRCQRPTSRSLSNLRRATPKPRFSGSLPKTLRKPSSSSASAAPPRPKRRSSTPSSACTEPLLPSRDSIVKLLPCAVVTTPPLTSSMSAYVAMPPARTRNRPPSRT
mmetsp:Transcript_3670/g.9171  ORF Transcript_3670/g.9171 Transcript_3670/m.9171 type:complete len:213 (-) Transcript_3670:80-718(-)